MRKLITAEYVNPIELIERELLWGLHDAHVLRLDIDWQKRMATFEAMIPISESQEIERLAAIKVTGLVYIAMDAPRLEVIAGNAPDPSPKNGLWIDSMRADSVPMGLPPIPEGCFLHRLFVHDWSASIWVCATNADFGWLSEPVNAHDGTSAHQEDVLRSK